MRFSMNALPVVTGALLVSVACGSERPEGEDAAAEEAAISTAASLDHACVQQRTAKNADKSTVVFCDEPYADAPRIRPPPDSASRRYLALDSNGIFVDRTGKELVALQAPGQRWDLEPTTPATGLRKKLHLPSHRTMFTVYAVKGVLTTLSDQQWNGTKMVPWKRPALLIDATDGAAVVPALQLPGEAIDRSLFHPWEALVPRRVRSGVSGAGIYDKNDLVPIRFSFKSLGAKQANLWEWGDSAHLLPDGERWDVNGTVETWTKSVTSEEGSCIESLAGDNPFRGATSAALKLSRVVAMHGQADETSMMTFPNSPEWNDGMITPFFWTPRGLLRTAFGPLDHAQGTPHGGTTSGAFILDVHPVTGGGTPCQPDRTLVRFSSGNVARGSSLTIDARGRVELVEHKENAPLERRHLAPLGATALTTLLAQIERAAPATLVTKNGGPRAEGELADIGTLRAFDAKGKMVVLHSVDPPADMNTGSFEVRQRGGADAASIESMVETYVAHPLR